MTVDVTSPTTDWLTIGYGNNNPDPSNDQQTGSGEGDIIGNQGILPLTSRLAMTALLP